MKKLAIITLGALVFCAYVCIARAQAASFPITWQGDPAATSYKVYQCTNLPCTNAADWTVAATVTQPNPFPADKYVSTTVNGPANPGLVLYRVSLVGAFGESIKKSKGVFFNEAWIDPSIGQVGVQ